MVFTFPKKHATIFSSSILHNSREYKRKSEKSLFLPSPKTTSCPPNIEGKQFFELNFPKLTSFPSSSLGGREKVFFFLTDSSWQISTTGGGRAGQRNVCCFQRKGASSVLEAGKLLVVVVSGLSCVTFFFSSPKYKEEAAFWYENTFSPLLRSIAHDLHER